MKNVSTIRNWTFVLGTAYCMGHARHIFLIAEVSDIDVHCRTGLVGLCIVNEEHLQLIGGQSDDSVGSIIQGGGLEAVREPLYRSVSVFSQGAVKCRRRLRLG